MLVKTFLVKIVGQRSLAQHMPVTFFLQGNSRSHRGKTITAISNKTAFTFSAIWNYRLKAFGYFIWCKTLRWYMFACPWQNSHWPQLPLHGAIWNCERGSDNKQTTRIFSDKSLSEICSYLLDGCHVLSLFLPNVRLKTVAFSLCLSRSLSRFNSPVFDCYRIKALWACCRTF